MIKDINAITPEYLKHRLEEQEECYKQEIERLKEDNNYLNKVNIELSTERNKLNNIINELEKDLNDRYYGRGKYHMDNDIIGTKDVLNTLQELKGEDKTFNERVEEIYNSHMKYIYDKEDKKIEKIDLSEWAEITYSDDWKMLTYDFNRNSNLFVNKINEIIDYLETFSSIEDVFKDMKRRLDRIDKIIGSDKE